MRVFLALIMLTICGGLIARAFARPSLISAFIATQALFSVGYYGLPMLLVERSTLRYVPEADVVAVILMALMYMVFLLLGVWFLVTKLRPTQALSLPVLDYMMDRCWWTFAIISNSIVIYYFSTRTFSFYQLENIDEFYYQQSPLSGVVAFISGIAQALTAVYAARALDSRDRLKIVFCAAGLLIQLYLAAKGANRLLFITPMLLVLGALVTRGRFRMAGIALASTVGALLVFSPVAVAMRAGSWNSTQDIQAQSFDYGDNPFETILQSIIDRGDLLYNMATLKTYVDRNGYVSWNYYWSVFSIPVPRYFYPNKPFVLSDDGTKDTEISILAWHLLVGPTTGSLTAFGSIVAYREGGWPWIPVNALLAGGLFAWLLLVFARGGTLGQAFATFSFTQWSVRKVPPSLFEALADVMTYLPIIVALIVAERLLRGDRIGLALDIPEELEAKPATGT